MTQIMDESTATGSGLQEEGVNAVASSSSPTEEPTISAEATASEVKEPESSEKNTVERHWDFSNRKVIVHNVMKFMKNKETTKMVASWMEALQEKYPDKAIDFEKFRKPPQDSFVVITMKEESMCPLLIQYINENKLKNKRGFELVAKPGTEESDDKKKRGAAEDTDPTSAPTSKRQRIIEESTTAARRPVTEEEIQNKVTPLWQLSADEQKSKKMTNMIKGCAMKIVANVKKRFRYVACNSFIYFGRVLLTMVLIDANTESWIETRSDKRYNCTPGSKEIAAFSWRTLLVHRLH
jgi:hypothetical protein